MTAMFVMYGLRLCTPEWTLLAYPARSLRGGRGQARGAGPRSREGQGEVAAVDEHEHKAGAAAQPVEPKCPGGEHSGQSRCQPGLARDAADGKWAHQRRDAEGSGGVVGSGAEHTGEG